MSRRTRRPVAQLVAVGACAAAFVLGRVTAPEPAEPFEGIRRLPSGQVWAACGSPAVVCAQAEVAP